MLADQPAKFAAMELIVTSGPNQPETIGGILVDGQVVGGIQIPNLASILGGFSPDTFIAGLDSVPIDEQPPTAIVHLAWDTMVGIGTALVLLGLWALVFRVRRRDYATSRWFLRAASIAGFAAVIALESGWIVTEVGRQPWVVFKILRTADAVTQAPGVQTTFIAVVALYTTLGVATLFTLRTLQRRWAGQDAAAGDRAVGDVSDESIPYGPHDRSDRPGS
jgi:cytochrome d ubiquinol oxidase subunit I